MSWNGIEPAFVERMATEYAAYRQRPALERAVTRERLGGVTGASRVETAALAQMWANYELIQLD
jgi:hypothetical protein